MAQSNVETARRGFEAALRGDLDAIAELLDADVKWHGGDPTAPGACHNRTEALAFMRQSDVIRGGRFELVDVVGIGDSVVVIMRPPSEGAPPAEPVANLTTFRAARSSRWSTTRTPARHWRRREGELDRRRSPEVR